jgi:hypothetical protein
MPDRTLKGRGKVLLACCTLIAALAAAEGLMRLRASLAGAPFTRAQARAEILAAATVMQEAVQTGETGEDGEAIAPRKSLYFLHPYFGFYDGLDWLREFDKEAHFYSQNKSRLSYDIVILGGSVAAGFGWLGRSTLDEVLLSDPRFHGRVVQYFNHGRAGFKQPQQLMLLSYLLTSGSRPDAVINIDGFNEVALSNVNASLNAHPLQPSLPHWGRIAASVSETPELMDHLIDLRAKQIRVEAAAQRALRLRCDCSALMTQLARTVLARMRSSALSSYERYTQALASHERRPDDAMLGTQFKRGLPGALKLGVQAWANASLAMQAMCEGMGIHYLHVLQPTLHDEGSKPLTPEEIEGGGPETPMVEGTREGYPLLREAGQSLRENGVNFLDATGIFREYPGTLYYDSCHFERHGHKILAQAIGQALLDSLPAELPDRAPIKKR